MEYSLHQRGRASIDFLADLRNLSDRLEKFTDDQAQAAGINADELPDDPDALQQKVTPVLEAMPEFQARWKTGVLSNADDGYLHPLLDRIGWKFPVALSSEGVGAYKPLPAAFQRVLTELGVGAEEAVYVGDTLYDDILGAKGVGMRSAWINRDGAAHDPLMPVPDFEIRSLTELPALLEAAS